MSLTGSVDAETARRVRVHAIRPDVVDTAMLTEGHTAGSLGSRIAHSGRVLAAGEVARQAVSLVGSRRVVLSLPAWRGGMTRLAGVAPSLARHAMPFVAARCAERSPANRPDASGRRSRLLTSFERLL